MDLTDQRPLREGLSIGWSPPPVVRQVIALGLGVYVVWLAVAYRYHFIDGVNLLIHEAGHVFFGFFGDVLGTAGGTLLQLLFIATLCRGKRGFGGGFRIEGGDSRVD